MKTVLIKVTTEKPIDLSKIIESIGLFNLKLNDNDVPIAFEFIEGVSSHPGYVNENCHVWKNFNIGSMSWEYFRVNLTEKGEQILKDNNIKYEYEK